MRELAGNSAETPVNESAQGWWDGRVVELSATYPEPAAGVQEDRVTAPRLHSCSERCVTEDKEGKMARVGDPVDKGARS